MTTPVAYRRMKKLIPQLLGFTLPKPTKTVYTVLRQLVQWIPPGMIQRLADEHKLDIRKWSAVSHVVALLYGQLAGCDSLNGIVDAARVHEGEWRNIRGATAAEAQHVFQRQPHAGPGDRRAALLENLRASSGGLSGLHAGPLAPGVHPSDQARHLRHRLHDVATFA